MSDLITISTFLYAIVLFLIIFIITGAMRCNGAVIALALVICMVIWCMPEIVINFIANNEIQKKVKSEGSESAIVELYMDDNFSVSDISNSLDKPIEDVIEILNNHHITVIK